MLHDRWRTGGIHRIQHAHGTSRNQILDTHSLLFAVQGGCPVRAEVHSLVEGAAAAAALVRVSERGSGLHELTFHLDTVCSLVMFKVNILACCGCCCGIAVRLHWWLRVRTNDMRRL